MTKYFKQLDEHGEFVRALSYDFIPTVTDPTIVEITEDEYKVILAAIIAANQPEETDEISAEEALDIILGVST